MKKMKSLAVCLALVAANHAIARCEPTQFDVVGSYFSFEEDYGRLNRVTETETGSDYYVIYNKVAARTPNCDNGSFALEAIPYGKVCQYEMIASKCKKIAR